MKFLQLDLPGVDTMHAHIKKNPIHVAKVLDLDAGLSMISLTSNNSSKLIDGIYPVPKKSRRLSLHAGGHLFCCKCGLEGKFWRLEKDLRDPSCYYSLQLYGPTKTDDNVALTWDHIIPKSLGGNDSLVNGQIMCRPCNQQKGMHISIEEIAKLDQIGRLRAMINSNPATYRHNLCKYIKTVKKGLYAN
jgi:hypothetical protein